MKIKEEELPIVKKQVEEGKNLTKEQLKTKN